MSVLVEAGCVALYLLVRLRALLHRSDLLLIEQDDARLFPWPWEAPE